MWTSHIEPASGGFDVCSCQFVTPLHNWEDFNAAGKKKQGREGPASVKAVGKRPSAALSSSFVTAAYAKGTRREDRGKERQDSLDAFLYASNLQPPTSNGGIHNASFLGISLPSLRSAQSPPLRGGSPVSEALLDIFHQPLCGRFFNSLVSSSVEKLGGQFLDQVLDVGIDVEDGRNGADRQQDAGELVETQL